MDSSCRANNDELPQGKVNIELCQQMFYAGEQGDVEKCRQLISQGANVNWKADSTLWNRTPLMQAAKEGQTEVCKLYVQHGAQVDAFTVSCYTALILAARYGRTETCKFLISKGANVNNQTKSGETALMWAAGHGHTETCLCLLNNGALPDTSDTYGITALIRAAKGGYADTVATLLEYGANVDLIATLGEKILDAESWAKAHNHRDVLKVIQSYKIYRSLLKDDSDPPTYVPLCACGSVNAGKTTLLTNLQLNFVERRLMRPGGQPDTSEDMASRTCGIDIGIINVPGVGEVRKMDMAGHSWAFTSNEYFVGKKTSISMVLFDLSKIDEDVENDLIHHLGLLKARETKPGIGPEVVLVATHADKHKNAEVRANAFFKKMLTAFQKYLNFYPKVMLLDCRDPSSAGYRALRDCLKELREKIIQNSERVPHLCSVLLPHIRSWAKERPFFPVMSWSEFVQRVKRINKAADDEGVRHVAFYLNESGEVVNDDSPELRDKVVLNVNWLTSHIFGIALAPTNFPRSLRFDTVNAVVGKDDLQSTFRECPFDQLIELLVRFEVCLPCDEQKLICNDYFFPSHLEPDPRVHGNEHPDRLDIWPQFNRQNLCVVGRIVECKNAIDTIPQSLFPKFQIRLMKRFGHRCPIWYGGIKLADDVVQILITLSPSLRALNLCVWAPKGCEERCYAAMEFIESLRERLFKEIAGGTELVHKALSIIMLHQKRFEGYRLEEVDRALKENGTNARVVLQEAGLNELALDVKYCGIRRYLYSRGHISHLPMRKRKELARLLDSGIDDSIGGSLSEHLGVAVENDDLGPSGFTNVMSNSRTDRALSLWALGDGHTGRKLIEILERRNRFDASEVVGRWLLGAPKFRDSLSGYRTRDESAASEWSVSSDRGRGTSGASEHSEFVDKGKGTGFAPGYNSSLQLDFKSRAASLPEFQSMGQRWDSSKPKSESIQGLFRPPVQSIAAASYSCGASENDSEPDMGYDWKGLRSTFGGSVHDMLTARSGSLWSGNSLKPERTRTESGLSNPTEESCSANSDSVEKLSLEESQIPSATQMVPHGTVKIDLCKQCGICREKLSVQETGSPKLSTGIEETSHDSQEQRDSAGDIASRMPVQVSHSDTKEEVSEDLPLSKPETDEGGAKSGLTLTAFTSQSIPDIRDLSSRMGLSWKPVALDLGFKPSELEIFEEAGLLRAQANQMLDAWLTANTCSFDCKECIESLLDRLEESFENAYRADLKDLLRHQRKE